MSLVFPGDLGDRLPAAECGKGDYREDPPAVPLLDSARPVLFVHSFMHSWAERATFGSAAPFEVAEISDQLATPRLNRFRHLSFYSEFRLFTAPLPCKHRVYPVWEFSGRDRPNRPE